jgi:hypothetical protein
LKPDLQQSCKDIMKRFREKQNYEKTYKEFVSLAPVKTFFVTKTKSHTVNQHKQRKYADCLVLFLQSMTTQVLSLILVIGKSI